VAESGARFPQPVSDIVCAIDFAVHRAAQAGVTATFVAVLGHSSGAHLAALAALGGETFRPVASPYPPVAVDGLVGLAGPYDVLGLSGPAQPLFGATPAQDPDAWRLGNPLTWAGQGARRAGLHVLLAHGTADDLVSTTFTTQFAGVLQANGYDVSVDLIDGATHQSIYRAAVIGPDVSAWLVDQLAGAGRTRPGPTPSTRSG
jgi:acetyl esterase/lipase